MPPYPVAPIIPAPDNPAEWESWRGFLTEWRTLLQLQLNYDDGLYVRYDFSWVGRCFSCAFVMLCDQAFYDHHTGHYLLDPFLDEGIQKFGGYDALVLWQAYPRIGFDSRNQFDFYRDMPGGLAAIKELSQRCHERGIKVFMAYNPWDTETRREVESDTVMLTAFVSAIEADGIFLDTMKHGAPEMRKALDAARPGVVLESENDLPIDFIHDHHMSWAQWFQDSHAPGVLRNKWFEQRHMQHLIYRWNHDHSDELHTAWMNGAGILVWENVFGSWVGWNARDRLILRQILPIQRRYASLFTAGRWTPLVPTLKDGIYASQWQYNDLKLWTIVNRTNQAIEGDLLQVANSGKVFDLIHGLELPTVLDQPLRTLSGRIEARGVAAFLAMPSADEDFRQFLTGQLEHLTETIDTRFPSHAVVLKALPTTIPVKRADITSEMVVLEGGAMALTVTFRVRECGLYESVPLVNLRGDEFALHQIQTMSREVQLSPYALDKREVSNRQFQQFLQTSGYQPAHRENFLKHWVEDAPPDGEADQPVVYIDLDDARAYTQWAGKRLPTEDEWQYGLNSGLVGYGARRVWNWTESEHSDGRTRFCILKGGTDDALIDPTLNGSKWYADGGPQLPEFSAKFLLMWPGLDRCATIGFRCAINVSE